MEKIDILPLSEIKTSFSAEKRNHILLGPLKVSSSELFDAGENILYVDLQ